MSVLVAGHAGLDRVWTLGDALRPGGRITVLAKRCRIGGAGANAAAALSALGCPARLAAAVAEDAAGDAVIAELRAAGVDVSAILRVPGATVAGDILLGADGERTLLTPPGLRRAVPAALLAGGFTVALVNLPRLAEPGVLRAVAGRALVVAQLPLDLAESRPAQVLLASRSDVGDGDIGELWRMRQHLDGQLLSHLVVTDGARGVAMADGTDVVELPAPEGFAGDSIGAGDFFAAGLVAALHGAVEMAAAIQAGQAAAARFLADRPHPVGAWRA